MAWLTDYLVLDDGLEESALFHRWSGWLLGWITDMREIDESVRLIIIFTVIIIIIIITMRSIAAATAVTIITLRIFCPSICQIGFLCV